MQPALAGLTAVAAARCPSVLAGWAAAAARARRGHGDSARVPRQLRGRAVAGGVPRGTRRRRRTLRPPNALPWHRWCRALAPLHLHASGAPRRTHAWRRKGRRTRCTLPRPRGQNCARRSQDRADPAAGRDSCHAAGSASREDTRDRHLELMSFNAKVKSAVAAMQKQKNILSFSRRSTHDMELSADEDSQAEDGSISRALRRTYAKNN